ncbi:MAG TPA: hypothetical protein VKA91_11445 [Nitrososphaeraceae archaeon]|nr:hypothetical protein [Nitrososphaeraceae archaeon]
MPLLINTEFPDGTIERTMDWLGANSIIINNNAIKSKRRRSSTRPVVTRNCRDLVFKSIIGRRVLFTATNSADLNPVCGLHNTGQATATKGTAGQVSLDFYCIVPRVNIETIP